MNKCINCGDAVETEPNYGCHYCRTCKTFVEAITVKGLKELIDEACSLTDDCGEFHLNYFGGEWIADFNGNVEHTGNNLCEVIRGLIDKV